MIDRRNFIKVVTGFLGGVYTAFVPKAESSKSSNMRPVTAEDRVNYCSTHSCRQCPFDNDSDNECMIDSWKETPVDSPTMKCEDGWHPEDDREATVERMRPADGKYLDGDEVQCFVCGRKIPLPKGYYHLGDRIECVCGNKAKFTMFVKVADAEDNNTDSPKNWTANDWAEWHNRQVAEIKAENEYWEKSL